MTNDLYATFGRRAERADTDVDVDEFFGRVHERAERGQRRLRNLTAAGSGVAVVAAVVAATVVASPTHDNGHAGPAGAGPQTSTNSSPTVSAAERRAAERRAAARAEAAAKRAEQARVFRQPPAAHDLRPHGHLVAVDPAPKLAPLSIGLSAKSWTYLASVSDATVYGTPNSPAPHDANAFIGKISLVVGDSSTDPGPFPLQVGRFRGSLHTSGGVQILNLSVRSDRVVTIQVPAAAGLTRRDVIDLGKTLYVRDLSHAASG